ncbi:M24 family metallopeptidase [Paracoccus sp. (in: a-proteobacteria)]|uniref:M24 family metallopeptidase n=1 Tax=Paracoccus sp. TaxID=267 RepID=UPI00322071FB
MSIDPMCVVGPRTAYMPHITYRRHKLNRGDTVYLEYTGTFERYNAPAMRSAVIGTPSDGVRRLSDAALETLDLLFANIRAGRTGDDVARAARKALDKAPRAPSFTAASAIPSAWATSRPGPRRRITSPSARRRCCSRA